MSPALRVRFSLLSPLRLGLSGMKKSISREKKYVRDFSLAKWPAPTHQPFIDEMLKPIAGKTYKCNPLALKPEPMLTGPPRLRMEDLAAVKVFYKEVGKTIFEEEATFTVALSIHLISSWPR